MANLVFQSAKTVTLHTEKPKSTVLTAQKSITSANTSQAYTGAYHVVPDDIDQELITKDKFMKDNVTVEKVPHWIVSNGKSDTFIIGRQ